MLNSFDKGPVQGNSREDAVFSTGDPGGFASQGIAHQGFLTRLYVRRWLIVLFAVIIFALSVFYGLPWQAEALALTSFALGAAAIPRFGLNSGLDLSERVPKSGPQPWQLTNSVLDALQEPAILLARDGTIFSFNGKARDLLGGLKAGSHISSATRSPQVLEAVMDCCEDTPVKTVIFSDRVPVERYMAATVSMLDTQLSDANPSILLFLRDLTEQRRVDQLRADFIANASHEIKTPLASLLGFIETLQGAARHDESARDRFLAIMAKQAGRMAGLIDNLMSLSRVEMRAHLKPQDVLIVDELILQACDALEPMAVEAGIKLSFYSQLNGASVLGDRDELTQVFINLIHNAIKYGRPNGSVTVRLANEQNSGVPLVAITVEDDGPGIPSQHLPRLTERFYRVPGSQALEKGGTGLGLAIVKHVINRHRGDLRIVSEEGKGSRFTVLLAEHIPGDCSERRTGFDKGSSFSL